MSLHAQAVVIGAGAVGLACARALALAGKEVMVQERNTDFQVQGPAEHGINGLVKLFGIESPGLTASLALAERVCECLETASAV